MRPRLAAFRRHPRLLRALALLAVCTLALQLAFVARIALMAFVDPQSTAFERSEAWRLVNDADTPWTWRQQWVDREALGETLPRAVLAAEDAGFVDHRGIEWDAIAEAFDRNRRAQARADERLARAQAREAARAARQQRAPRPIDAAQLGVAPPKIVGGSTITQQLAKNLFLSGERAFARKAQEAALTVALEALLDKDRILTLYLNHVEWGEGVFGAQAAAQTLGVASPAALTRAQAARLAVRLPAPKRYERDPATPGLAARAARVMASMDAVELP